MLQNLHVKNLALIDETEVDFGPGLNILTGETGAGKSILLGSVGLALGAKYSADMLRNGSDSGLVELTFTVDDEKLKKRLEALDIFPEGNTVTLSRRLMQGRSLSRINGETVSMSTLRDAASMLIDIHGQHDNQTLLNRKNHLALLDLYAGEELRPVKEEMRECYRRYQEICRQEEACSLDEEERRRELSLAEFEVNEIEESALEPGEDEELEELYRRMTESRKITEAVGETYRYTCEDAAGNASDCLSRAIRAFQDAAEFDETGAQLYSQLLDADSLLNDFNRELSEYAKSFEFSEDEFKETGERLNLINHLKAKYGNSVKEILAYCEEKKKRIEELTDYDSYREKIREEKERSLAEVQDVTDRLSGIRRKYASEFANAIREQMTELNFMDTRLELRVADSGHFSANGRDEAEFYLAVNPGEPMKALGNIASGGELSRIMLALKAVLAEKLRLIGKSRQVICITHLPQIASAADLHFVIRKEAKDHSVQTRIHLLDEEASVSELARLLGGASVTEHIVESAREMKELAKREI